MSTGRPRRAPTPHLLESRRAARVASESLVLADGVHYAERSWRDVAVGVFDPPEPCTAGVICYLHGGGFRQGSVRGWANYTSHLAALAGARLVSVDYRLAPEDPFPCGLEDAVAAYRHLADGLEAPVAIVGDSAGGGLAASLLGEVERLGLRRPVAVGLLSPWVDLRNAAASFAANAASDQVFPLASAVEAADMYLAGWDPADPRVSPLLANWSGRPPLFVAASETECLRDDAWALAETARAAGVDVDLTTVADAPHGWWLHYPATPESRDVVTGLAAFLRRGLDVAERTSKVS